MSRRTVLVSVIGLCVSCLLVMSSCVAPRSTPAPPLSAEPDGESVDELMGTEALHSHMSIIEWPSEARPGEYISVKVQITTQEHWDWLRSKLIEAGETEYLQWLGERGPTYELTITKDYQSYGYDHSFGLTTPDDEFIITWYAQIPTTGGEPVYDNESQRLEWQEGAFVPGSYKLELRVWCGGYEVIQQRNIIIK